MFISILFTFLFNIILKTNQSELLHAPFSSLLLTAAYLSFIWSHQILFIRSSSEFLGCFQPRAIKENVAKSSLVPVSEFLWGG